MNTLELVKSRRSVRSFDGKAPDKETVMDILQYAYTAANPYSLPITWKVMSAKKNGLSTPVISGTDAFIAGKLQKAPHAEEAFGYTKEGCHIELLLSDSLHYIIDFYAPMVLTWLRSTTERALQITAPSTPHAAASIIPCTPTSKTTNMSGFDAPFDATNP